MHRVSDSADLDRFMWRCRRLTLLATLQHTAEVEDWLWWRAGLADPRAAVEAELRRLARVAAAAATAPPRGDRVAPEL